MHLLQCERGVGQAAPLLSLLLLLLQRLLPFVFELLDPRYWRLPLQQSAGESWLQYRSLLYHSCSGANKSAHLMQTLCRAYTLVGGASITPCSRPASPPCSTAPPLLPVPGASWRLISLALCSAPGESWPCCSCSFLVALSTAFAGCTHVSHTSVLPGHKTINFNCRPFYMDAAVKASHVRQWIGDTSSSQQDRS